MTLPASGAITLAQVNTELGLSATAAITLNDAAVRSLFVKPSGAIALSDGYGKSNRTYATWNPADKNAAITLSAGNLTATTPALGDVAVRSTINKSSGKWYWEVHIDSGFVVVGIGLSSASLSSPPGTLGNGTGWASGPGKVLYNGTQVAATTAASVGTTMGFALDATANTLGLYRNNVLLYTVSTVENPSFASIGSTATAGVATANFGASALTYTPPSGFNAGLYS